MAFYRVHPVGRDQDEPVCGAALAVRVGLLAHHPGDAFGRARGAEDRGKELVLDRPLARPLLRLAFGELPVRAVQLGVEHFSGDRWPVLRIEVDAPPGNTSAQLLAR